MMFTIWILLDVYLYSEAEILEQLGSHDQIPRLLAYFEADEGFCLVQELIVGYPLNNELQLGTLWQESQVIQLLQDVLPVLEFVHSYGVIHRDIKPSNLIRRTRNGKIVLIDFGAVKQIHSQVVDSPSQIPATVAIGTPGYMPAEQAQGKPPTNSHIYALGMIAIQALTGLLPTQLPENTLTGEIVWQDRVRVSPRLESIIQRMVYYHYRDRYQSTTKILQDLPKLTNPLPDILHRHPIRVRGSRYNGGNPRTWAGPKPTPPSSPRNALPWLYTQSPVSAPLH